MKIVVLNGSPKGEVSVTLQYVRYIQQQFPQHELRISHISQRIKQIEHTDGAFVCSAVFALSAVSLTATA